MQIEPVAAGDGGHRGDIVSAAGRGAADGGNDGCRQQAGCAVGADGGIEGGSVHAAQRPARGDVDQVVLADAGDPAGLVDGGMGLVGGIDADGRGA